MKALMLGEFLGTLVLILFGGGVVAGVLLGKSKAANAGWIVITAGWGFAVLCGIITAKAFGAPGALNPVGPIADIVNGNGSMENNLAMIIAEFLGAFVGACVVWLHYLPHWKETSDPGLKRAVFCTSPAIRDPLANFLSECIGTFALVFIASANGKVITGDLGAPMTGMLVWAIGLSLGATTGYAINPARDLAPRLAHALLPIDGKGGSDWSYAWVPVVGPIVGGVAGAVAFKALLAI